MKEDQLFFTHEVDKSYIYMYLYFCIYCNVILLHSSLSDFVIYFSRYISKL